MPAMVVHCPVVGDHISAGRTACAAVPPSVAVSPPVATTDPSGSTVRLWNARGYAIGPAGCHAGDGSDISSTYVVAVAAPLIPFAEAVPDFMTRPGKYITALPPSMTRGSIGAH